MSHQSELKKILAATRASSFSLAATSLDTRNEFLLKLADNLLSAEKLIYDANKLDLQNASESNVSQQLIKRLMLQEDKLHQLIKGLKELARLPDPLNKITLARELDAGLNLFRVTCPIGVICIIFESRPEAVIQISSLAIKSGNCILLKGGKESENSNKILVEIIQETLEQVSNGLCRDNVYLVTTREDVKELLECDEYIDLIIPRGGNALVKYIKKNTSIPVMGHADGVCHIFVDESIDAIEDQAINICVDSKTEYPAVCNACESILVHDSLKESFLPKLVDALLAKNVTIHCHPTAYDMLRKQYADNDKLIPICSVEELEDASDDKLEALFKREYLTLDVSLFVVPDIENAIYHINKFGSHHTDCILGNDQVKIDKFFKEVDSAGVFNNCSTRFADGFRYGFGAEVGVSTNKLHARGPVGMDGLLTYKYRMLGHGHIVDDYNKGKKSYSHRNLPL